MIETISGDLVFRFFVLNVSLLGALVLMDYIKSGFNEAILVLVAKAKTATETELFPTVVSLGFIAIVIVILLLLSGFVIPSHDFVIIGAPNFHALFSSLRSIVIGIAALVALPALLIGFVMLVAMYTALLVDAALALTGGRMSSILSVFFAVTSTYFLLSETSLEIAFLFIAAQVALLLIVYVMRPSTTSGSWADTGERVRRMAGRVIILVCFSAALALATFALWLGYFSIQIADNDQVEWAGALSCPIKVGELQTIDDFFLSETIDQAGGLVRPLVRPAPETLFISNRSYGFAAKTSGPSRYARIRILAIQSGDDENTRVVNQTGAGGYFLGKGFFVYRFHDSFEGLFEGMQSGRVLIAVSIMPQGRIQYSNVQWLNMFGAYYNLTRGNGGIETLPVSLSLAEPWTHLPCTDAKPDT